MLANSLRRASIILKLTISRQIHTSSVANASEKSPLFILRQRTGIAYSLCREALNKHENDINQAEAWLKAQALALGLQRAGKVSGRSAREGLIGLAINPANKITTIIELNCETDFVAKNELFRNLSLDLTQQIATMQNDCNKTSLTDDSSIEKLILNEDRIKTLDNHIVPIITKLGENIRVQKAIQFRSNHQSVQLFGQIHSKGGQRVAEGLHIMTGRFCAIVGLKDLYSTTDTRSLKPFGDRLCHHVIGYSQTYIELPDIVRKNLEEAEKDRKDREVAINNQTEGENSDNEDQEDSPSEDWPSMMDQKLILGEGETVREFCKDNGLSIIYFNRFECGADEQESGKI